MYITLGASPYSGWSGAQRNPSSPPREALLQATYLGPSSVHALLENWIPSARTAQDDTTRIT